MFGGRQRPYEEHGVPLAQMNVVAQQVAILNERRLTALAEIDKATFSGFHVKICLVAGVGFFAEAYDIFAITIAATMLGFVYGPWIDPTNLRTLTNWQTAGLKVATPAGNLIGQLLFGWLADILGRKRMYGVELAIMIVATFGQAVSGHGPSLSIIYILIFWRVIMGVGVGGDYPLSAVITSEFASTRSRGRLMTVVFSSQGWGQLAASLVGLIVVVALKDAIQHSPITEPGPVDFTWRLLIGLGCVPALIALYFRLTIPETPRFTMDIDRNIGRAARDIRNVLTTNEYTPYVDDDTTDEPRVAAPRASSRDFTAHFSKFENLKVLFGTSYSWFALDVVFYMLTLNSDTILTLINFGNVYGDVYKSLFRLCVGNIILTVGGYIPGFWASFVLIDVWGRKPIQFMGFIILTILFWIMSFDYNNLSNTRAGKAFMALFCLANFFQNFGPNTTTFIVPGEAFPTRYRSTAHGISAASGKLGAVIAQFVFGAAIQYNLNLGDILKGLSFVMLTGVFSTLLIPETNQRTLEDLSNEDQAAYITGIVGRVGDPVPEA
ncbi:major facilitator superfamily domain-containing protein [Butyriboletus roseoflavus]|nr:major facilitator superfamily domain-containing protein [Butyriboletus roseoflavus]